MECTQQYIPQPYTNPHLKYTDTGAGGQQEPYLVNGANSLTFGIMVFGCSMFAILANKFGLKVLVFGTLGYATLLGLTLCK